MLTHWMAKKKKVLTVASNAGTLPGSGIVPPERAKRW